jgi:hypothetical protein
MFEGGEHTVIIIDTRILLPQTLVILPDFSYTVIIIDTRVLLPQTYVILPDFSYTVIILILEFSSRKHR